jgi:hypothetical protein
MFGYISLAVHTISSQGDGGNLCVDGTDGRIKYISDLKWHTQVGKGVTV